MALRFNTSITTSKPALILNIGESFDSGRRNNRSRSNRSFKLEKKIHGTPKKPEIISSLLWDFNEPGGTEVVNYTFNFSGSIGVLDFGDGTSQDSVTSGQTITKIYS